MIKILSTYIFELIQLKNRFERDFSKFEMMMMMRQSYFNKRITNFINWNQLTC